MVKNPNGDNLLIDSTLDIGEHQIATLKKFWRDISWWERDESLNFTQKYLGIIAFSNLSQEQSARVTNLRSDIQLLQSQNNRPSKIIRWLPFYSRDDSKPNYRICVDIIMSMSTEDLLKFGQYLGIPEIESFAGRKNELFQFLLNLGQNCPLAMFYAYRNYLDKWNRNRV